MPPTVADLIFTEQANHNFSRTLGDLKRKTLSIHNRLRSILQDAEFAQAIADAYNRPLIANERCGSWYIDPEKKSGSAYFKSTDGHTGVWKFSSRRLNLHLLDIVGKNDGCIIIDSTRRGKRMPDALSKTVPIWCCVLNRVLFPEREDAHELYTPPQVVSGSEHAQMTNLIPSFIEAFQALNLSEQDYRRDITKPIRPIWITPESQILNTDEVFHDFHPIICCTVSRRVSGGEASEGGYIQGAGDDTENWAHGLTPKIFWGNQQSLLDEPEEELPGLIASMIQHDSASPALDSGLRLVKPTSCMFLARSSTFSTSEVSLETYVIALLPTVTPRDTWVVHSKRMEIGLGTKKIGSKNLRAALKDIADFGSRALEKAVSDISYKMKLKIVAYDPGQDLSIGAILALLCLHFDESGALISKVNTESHAIDKNYIRRRLSWISTCMPDMNPSRATLQSVNSFLMPP
ncbi:tRNA A64-2'-O-ribosylphosphate transferase [Clarireedia jacksonii]